MAKQRDYLSGIGRGLAAGTQTYFSRKDAQFRQEMAKEMAELRKQMQQFREEMGRGQAEREEREVSRRERETDAVLGQMGPGGEAPMEEPDAGTLALLEGIMLRGLGYTSDEFTSVNEKVVQDQIGDMIKAGVTDPAVLSQQMRLLFDQAFRKGLTGAYDIGEAQKKQIGEAFKWWRDQYMLPYVEGAAQQIIQGIQQGEEERKNRKKAFQESPEGRQRAETVENVRTALLGGGDFDKRREALGSLFQRSGLGQELGRIREDITTPPMIPGQSATTEGYLPGIAQLVDLGRFINQLRVPENPVAPGSTGVMRDRTWDVGGPSMVTESSAMGMPQQNQEENFRRILQMLSGI